MSASRYRAYATALGNLPRTGLGTTITANEGVSKATVSNFCQQIGNTVCCKFLGGGEGTNCPSGTGPVDSIFQNVTLEITKPGFAQIIAGPYPTESGRAVLSDEFPLPGVTKTKKEAEADIAAKKTNKPSSIATGPGSLPGGFPYTPGGYPGQQPYYSAGMFDLSSFMNQYSTYIAFGAGALILGLILTRK